LHVVALLWFLLLPTAYRWCIGAILFNHLLLALITVMPRSALLGPNLSRLSEASISRNEVAITFDDGPDPEITPQVLDLLDHYNVKATFFCIGTTAAVNPHLLHEIIRRGHTVENHSYSHSFLFGFFGPARLHKDIFAAQREIAAITGCMPIFFRAPVGIHNPILDWVLAHFGLYLVSWSRRSYDTISSDPQATLGRITRNLAAGDILVLHDVRDANGRCTMLEVLPPLLDTIDAAGLRGVTLTEAMRQRSNTKSIVTSAPEEFPKNATTLAAPIRDATGEPPPFG
jgi:peptidoglycan/xylan/chitin deacetylase (PgdA/CDA1 family)